MRLKIDQESMGRQLGVSREWISKLERGHETPSQAIQAAIDRLEVETGIRKREPTPTPLHKLPPSAAAFEADEDFDEARFRDQLHREHLEKQKLYEPTIASEAPRPWPPARRMPTREDCEGYLRRVLDAAVAEGSPENIPAIYHRLKRQFPVDEFQTPTPTGHDDSMP
jgi:transcriptional regulator with XRE-family HTH domain